MVEIVGTFHAGSVYSSTQGWPGSRRRMGRRSKVGTCQHDFSKMSVGVNVRRFLLSLLSIAILIISFFWTFAYFSHLKNHLQSGMLRSELLALVDFPIGSTMVGSWPIGNLGSGLLWAIRVECRWGCSGCSSGECWSYTLCRAFTPLRVPTRPASTATDNCHTAKREKDMGKGPILQRWVIFLPCSCLLFLWRCSSYLQLHNLTLHGNSPPRFELV